MIIQQFKTSGQEIDLTPFLLIKTLTKQKKNNVKAEIQKTLANIH